MAEKRVKRRHRKRIPVRFGIGALEKVAFTDDINHEGLFIRSSVVAKEGVTLQVELQMSAGTVNLIGVVRWIKKVPANYLHKLRGGMGVEIQAFVSGEEIYHAMCKELNIQRGE